MSGEDDERQAGEDERQAQQLAHGDDATQQIAQLCIGHAHELDEETDDAVPHHEHAHKRALGQQRFFAAEHLQDAKEHDALEKRLVELRGMARHIARGATEDHAPGQIGRLAPQLAVNKVGATPQAQGQRSADDGKVCQRPCVELIHAAHDDAADNATHQTTVETHAALVRGKDLERMGPVVAIAVKDDIEQARADNESKDHADYDARQVVNRDVKTPTALRTVHDDRRE